MTTLDENVRMKPSYHFHKLANIASHVASSSLGIAALYSFSQGRTGDTIFYGAMAGLAEVFGYIVRGHQKFGENFDRESEIERKAAEAWQEQWRQDGAALRQQDLEIASLRGKEMLRQYDIDSGYWRGRADQAHEFAERAWESLDRTIDRLVGKKKLRKGLITPADYRSKSWKDILVVGLIPVEEYQPKQVK